MRYIHSSTKHPLLTRYNHSSKIVEVPNNFVLLNDDDIAILIDAFDATNTTGMRIPRRSAVSRFLEAKICPLRVQCESGLKFGGVEVV